MSSMTEETDNNAMLDTILFIQIAIAEISKELHSSVSERNEGLDEKLNVVISYAKDILIYSEKLGKIGDPKHRRFVSPLLPKVLPTCLLDSFSYCNDVQNLLRESDVERYADTLMELFTVSTNVFQFYCQSIRSYVVEETSQDIEDSAELLDRIARLGVVLTELDLTSGIKAWNTLISIFEAKKNSWFQEWRPATTWRHILTTVEKLLNNTFNETVFSGMAIRGSVTQCLESGEMFTSLLTSSFLLEPQYSQFVEEKSELVQTILELIDACTSEMMVGGFIPGVQLPGQPLPMLPIYEVIVTKIQALTATLLPEEVEDVVRVLLKFVSQPGLSGFAASDTLVFMARYGTESFCFELFQLSEQTIADLSCLTDTLSVKNQRLVALTRRLAFMLAPSDTPKIASSPYVPITQWDEDSVEVILASLLIVEEWTVARLEKLVSSCEKIVWNPGLSTSPFCKKVVVRLCEVLEKFSGIFHFINKDQGTCYLVKLVLSSVLQAVSTLDPTKIDEETHHQAWKSCNKVVRLNCSDVDISVLDFMERWLRPDFKEPNYKQQIFGLYSETFHFLFKRYYQAQSLTLAKLLSLFSSFAEVCQEESVLQCCLPEDAHTLVSSFLTLNEQDFDIKKNAEKLKNITLEYSPVLLEFQGGLEEGAQRQFEKRSFSEDKEEKIRVGHGSSDTVDDPVTSHSGSSEISSFVSQIENVADKLAQAIRRDKVLEETDRKKLRDSISLLNSVL